ncbi:MAG TPA: hypothetical protein VFL76_03905 [Edaphocola sp.]|nr:hypothetical protein [Edaphocola sp.]
MKRIITTTVGLSLLMGTVFVTSSCNKKQDWNCKCTVNGNESTSVIHDETRKDAKAECNKSGSVLGVDYDCHIELL